MQRINKEFESKEKPKELKSIELISFALLIILGVLIFNFSNKDQDDFSIPDNIEVIDFNSCIEAGNPAMESYPRQCIDEKNNQSFTEDIGNILEIKNSIQLNFVRPNQSISSPLMLEGRALGTWYFEGDIPVILTDWDGKIIAEGFVTAQDDWMTEEFVQFKGELEFEKSELDNRGTLILKKNNPSDNSELDDALEISVLLE